MTREELQQTIQSLSLKDQKKIMEDYDNNRKNLLKASVSQVLARNQSHGVGKHITHNPKLGCG
jgi:hypothetical protein